MSSLYPATDPTKPPLRVGVMLDGWEGDAWVADVLADVTSSGVAEFTTVILNTEPAPKSTWTGRIRRLLTGRSRGLGIILWLIYQSVDRRMRPAYSEPFRRTDLRPFLANASTIEVMPVRTGFVHRFQASDIEAVRGRRLDVILRFGFNIIRGDILGAARYGVWSYHHGDNTEYRGGPAGFWEMYERNPLTGAILQVLTEELDGGTVIYRSVGATRSFDSLAVNRFYLYRKTVPFVARCLRRLHEHGASGITPEPPAPPYTRGLYRTPRNGRMLWFLSRTVARMVGARIRSALRVTSDHWFLASGTGIGPGQPLAGRLAPLGPPRGRFWADPNIAQRDGRRFLFFEDYEYATRRGRISVADLDEHGRLGEVRTALETAEHLSYPFVFEWNAVHYMVPETASTRSVRLYRAVEFPARWEFAADLLTEIRAVDATLWQEDGRWYLFTGVAESGGSSWDELFLFTAATPLGPWTAHPMNPIVSDVRCARPAGPLFRRDGVLYRPAQNSARSYGHSIAVMEVVELGPERFAENLAFTIEPDWLPSINGCHTIATSGDLMVLDCKKVAWRP